MAHSMQLLYAFALFQLALLALVLRLYWRNRAMKKRQDALVAGLQGQRYWRINMARQPFFQRWLRVLPFEAKGVLIDEGAQLRIQGFWLNTAKAFDVAVEKSQCQVEWLGNRSLRAGNLYWAELVTARWRLLFCADTGMYALPSREALADIFRSVFPQIPLDKAKTSDFALEKNPRSLVAVCLFLALMLFALLDSFVFNHFELVDAALLKGVWPLLVGALLLLILPVLFYRWLASGAVPARESLVLSMMLTLSILLAALPLAKRADQVLAGQPAQMHAYRINAPGKLEPVDTSQGLPSLDYSRLKEYWAQFPDGTVYQVPLLRGPLGLWQLDHQIFDVPIQAFYKNPANTKP